MKYVTSKLPMPNLRITVYLKHSSILKISSKIRVRIQNFYIYARIVTNNLVSCTSMNFTILRYRYIYYSKKLIFFTICNQHL